MWKDEIVEAVRAEREKLLAEFDGDLEALAHWLQECQAQSGRELVSLPPRPPAPTSNSAA